jgi:hypothetical protein
MNMRDSALDLMQVLQVALSRYEDKLSREVSLELVEHFVEHNKRIDQILGFVQKPVVKEPTAQLEAPAQPQLTALAPVPATEPVTEPLTEPVAYVKGQAYHPDQVVVRKGVEGHVRLVKAHQGPLPDGTMYDYPDIYKFFPLRLERAKAPPANTGDPSIVVKNGRLGRMIKVNGWTHRNDDGSVRQHMPDHKRFRPLGRIELARLGLAKEPESESEPRPRLEPQVINGVHGQYPKNDMVVNGVHGRMIRIPAHNKMQGTKFIMVPAKEIFRPWVRKGGVQPHIAIGR